MSLKKKLINFSAKFEKNSFDYSYPLQYCLPVYHTVSNEDLPHLKHIIQYKNTQQFEHDLEVFLKYFQFLTWDEFKDFQGGNFKPKKKAALLTFDDGLREFYDVIMPVLEKKGIYAINFINPHFIDNNSLMFRCKASLIIEKLHQSEDARKILTEEFKLKNPQLKSLIKKVDLINYLNQSELDILGQKLGINFDDFLQKQQPYLSSEQLKALTEKGFGISAHSWDHPLYFELSLEEQLETTVKTLDYLSEKGFLAESFAFPFTDFGVKKEFFTQLFEKKKLFCSFGSAGIKTDSFERNFQRIPMETGESAEEILKDQISYFKLKKLLYKNKIRRK